MYSITIAIHLNERIMLLKTEDKKDFELSFRPVADPTEIINEKTDKKDIIITIFLYVVMVGIIIYNLI